MDRSTTIIAFLGGLIVALIAILLVVLLSGDDGDAGAAATTTSSTLEDTTTSSEPASTTEASTTTAATTTTAVSATTAPSTTIATTTTAAPCAAFPSVAVPAGASDVSTTSGDLDGDGSSDTVSVYSDGGTWYVHVELASGFGARVAFTPFDPGAVPTADRAMYVGTAEDVALVMTGFGLPGPIYGVWFFAGCEVREAMLDGGQLELWAGGGLMHSETFVCTDDGITFVEAVQPGSDPDVWDVTLTPYDWVPGLGEFQTQPSSTYTTTQDGALSDTSDIFC